MKQFQPPQGNAAFDGALLLLGHGSDRDPASARPVRSLARELRRRGQFGEVRVGFWKEEPYLHQVLWTVDAPEVVVVPIFTSEGYYTDRVIPRELGMDSHGGRPPGLAVHICPPLGTHPGMAEVILDRARPDGDDRAERGRDGDDDGIEAPGTRNEALVLVGHGTPRHPASGDVTQDLADTLRTRWPHGPVAAAFLDQAPRVAEVIRGLGVRRAVVVPFFISEGWHAGETLPGSLAVEGGVGRVDATTIRYAPPVGTHPRMVDFVVDLAAAGARSLSSLRDIRPFEEGS